MIAAVVNNIYIFEFAVTYDIIGLRLLAFRKFETLLKREWNGDNPSKLLGVIDNMAAPWNEVLKRFVINRVEELCMDSVRHGASRGMLKRNSNVRMEVPGSERV